MLPPSTFGSGPLKWIYLTLGMLMAATMVDMYVPLFGQRLAHLHPSPRDSSARGWRSGGRSARSAARRCAADRVIVRTVAVAPLVMAVGLALAALTQYEEASIGLRRHVGAGAADHRRRGRDRVAAPVGVGDGLRRRPR